MAEQQIARVTIEEANIPPSFRNFSGRADQYNREGDRNFLVLLPPDVAVAMERDGWNVKFLKPREDGDSPQPYLQVAVSYRNVPPSVYTISARGRSLMSEDIIGMLDWAEVENFDIVLQPYRWEVSGKSGVKAYLHTLYATLRENELDRKYANVPDAADSSSGAPHFE